ncbi:hypothetical protein JCM5353_002711 [Sporobolomyces roseus]
MNPAPHSSAKIDHLSSLPPELLLSIFDLSYDPAQLPLEPLSTTLLPYFRRNLYRQIRLSSRSSWSKLVRTVKDSPGLGEVVHILDTAAVFVFAEQGQFEEIVKPFPRLVSLKTGYLQAIQRTSVDIVRPPLEHLSYECDTFSFTAIVFLAKLNLSTLEIHFHSTYVRPYPSPLPRLTSLEKLSLVSKADDDDAFEGLIWKSSLADIIDYCPNITSLRLFDPVYPQYENLVSALDKFHGKLTSLELDSAWLTDTYDIPCDHLLPQFSQVTYLSLGDGITTESLPRYLRQMTSLSTLRLGIDAHLPLQIDTLLPLFQGSTKHPSLTRLVLDCFKVSLGHRVGANGEKVGTMVVKEMSGDGWKYPELYNLTEGGLSYLFDALNTYGVQVEGSGATIVQDLVAYHREIANRAVLVAFQTKSFEAFKRSPNCNSLLSHVNINDLDPNNLKLVKIDLPSENWFALSLE